MVQPGIGLDTPRTNVGDATYLSRAPDFDITQEPSFQSPSKEPNVFQSLRNGTGRSGLRTPRGTKSRAPFSDRMNLPGGIGGAEFTPLLKSATRNSARRRSGKENGLTTPALGKISEDMTPVQVGESSMYRSRDQSYVDRTPLPEADSDSTASTPMIMRRGKGRDGGPLQDGQQLSLREQENVIDKIEKENFGLKLKIHFLEEALRKAGPGFGEAALKENTELKVDKVTMSRELQRYKKHLTSAEKDLENYRQQMAQMHESVRNKQGSHDHSAELEKLRRDLEEKDADLEDMQHQIQSDHQNVDRVAKLQDEIGDLEADLREKERAISERDDELDGLRSKARQTDQQSQDEIDRLRDDIEDLQANLREKDRVISEHEGELSDLRSRTQQAEEKAKKAQIRMIELEEKAQASDKLEDARESIQDLEANVRELERQVDDAQEKLEDALSEKERAEADLEELQEEMADKSVVTKGLPRQLEEKLVRLQDEVEAGRHDYESLEAQFNTKQAEIDDLRLKLKDSRQERDASEHERRAIATRMEELQAELNSRTDEKNLLQSRHAALTAESASLQRDVTRLQKSMTDLQGDLEQERQHSLSIERELRAQYKADFDKLNNEISDLQAEVREKENLYDNDCEKWDTERHNLESERDRAEERVLGLQKTIERLRDAEGSLNDKESKLQRALQSETDRHHNEEAVLSRQIDDLQQDLSDRQQILEDLRSELSAVRDEIRQAQLDKQAAAEKAEGLEDEVEVLQVALDEESEKSAQEIETLTKECDDLRQQLRELRRASEAAHASTDSSRQTAELNAKAMERLEKQLDEYKSSLSKATQEKRVSDRECEELRQQLKELRRLTESAKASTDASHEEAEYNARAVQRLESQLAEFKYNIAQVTQEKKDIQSQLTSIRGELHSVQTRLAETQAERDEIDVELQRSKEQDNDTFQIDQERINLRATKARLENEIRRLKENNRVLADQRDSLEKTLEEELDKAETEEERLNQEILSLQTKVRQGQIPDTQDVSKARRTIRELERKIANYEHQLAQTTVPINALEGNSEMSLIKRDLSAARQKELEFMQKEGDHRAQIRGLKRQIGDLERRAHEVDISRMAQSPLSENASARKAEVSELRHQLSSAHQSISELKRKLRESERNAASMERDLQRHLENVEDEKMALEQALEDAQLAAEEARADLDEASNKYKRKAERYKKERDSMADTLATTRRDMRNHMHDSSITSNISSVGNGTVTSEMTREERHDLYSILRKTQIDAEALEREVREHKEALDELVTLEKTLRVKLDRARSERAQYRSDVEKLQRDMKHLKKGKDEAEKTAEAAKAAAAVARARATVSSVSSSSRWKGKAKEGSEPVLRAVEPEEGDDEDSAAEAANDDNAARVIHFRDDNDTQVHTDAIVRAAEAAEHRHVKQMRGMTMQMEWMQARWERELRMRDDAAFAKKYLQLELSARDTCNQADLLKLEGVFKQLGMKERPYSHVAAHKERTSAKRPFTLKRLAIALRFIAKLRIAAREWQKHEKTRKMLADKWESYKREDRIRAHQLRFREARAAAAFVPPSGEGMLKGVALP
ncbi:putative tropomyosin-1 alpha chain [Diaporthe ampelina]|uniref:Putative tropomyosin-1 alpha chain n=1 Tax=Diaporthe ampelina TaxID=1214573 RepID=A0A0G2F6V9_9PEZI|nr:putative tropomyosin-1 alpha chain [Diaporthe ampelina]